MTTAPAVRGCGAHREGGVETPCIIAPGNFVLWNGYKQIKRNGKKWRAHRWAWVQKNGPIPPGMLVLHDCDNPPCWNDEHLYIGDHKQNAADREARHRHPHLATKDQRGESNGHARLTERQVREIRSRAGTTTNIALAIEYGVTPSAIGHIVKRRQWKDVV